MIGKAVCIRQAALINARRRSLNEWKEHINNLETNILLVENDVSQSDEIITESLCLISQIGENIII